MLDFEVEEPSIHHRTLDLIVFTVESQYLLHWPLDKEAQTSTNTNTQT